ncbi:MAG: Rieske (2Fe-2S) protein [Gemmatimonadaceae bacterium]
MAQTIARRAFLATCAAVPFAGACARMTYVSGRLDGGRVVVTKAALGDDGFAMVDVPTLNFPIYVHRHGEDDYSAVLTRCMHRGCTVEPTAGRLVCPCHGSEYTASGAVLKGPTERALTAYPVTTDAEHIYIHDAVRERR